MGLRCWPGCYAYIVAPWFPAEDHGTVVTVSRAAVYGETVLTRGGELSKAVPRRALGWLCDASGDRFPCFIADECLRPITPPPGTEVETVSDVVEAARGVPVE